MYMVRIYFVHAFECVCVYTCRLLLIVRSTLLSWCDTFLTCLLQQECKAPITISKVVVTYYHTNTIPLTSVCCLFYLAIYRYNGNVNKKKKRQTIQGDGLLAEGRVLCLGMVLQRGYEGGKLSSITYFPGARFIIAGLLSRPNSYYKVRFFCCVCSIIAFFLFVFLFSYRYQRYIYTSILRSIGLLVQHLLFCHCHHNNSAGLLKGSCHPCVANKPTFVPTSIILI